MLRQTAGPPWDLLRAGMLRAPLLYTSDDSWHGHIPFAFWCVETLRPGVLVEVRSLPGDSYFAFCQAVEETPTNTRCYAVGTWDGQSRGDRETGESVPDVQRYNEARYAPFSSLLRGTPAEAVSQFADASIDLLHIDGSSDDEEAGHVFSTWLPKVSRTGVVLLHDVQAGEVRSPVSRLWEEIRHTYPFFSFPHGHGLGVLAVGPEPPESMRRLTSLDDQGAEDVRQLFARLGDAVRLQSAYQDLARRGVRIAELQASVAEREASLESLKDALTQRSVEASALRAEASALRAEREAILRSTSWRASAPLRFVGHLLRRTAVAPDRGDEG